MSQTTRSSTRHLSDVARHVVKPSGIVRTGWTPVEHKLKALGLRFDDWQADLAKLILAKRADGLYACTVGGVFLSLPRQVGKTYVLSAIIFALCLLNPGMTVLWTAHRLKTTGETHKSWKGLAKRKAIAPLIEAIRSGSGDWEVQFTNGSRILLGARENGFGRGFAKVDIIVYDEAQILTDKALDDMIPAANASTFPAGGLVLYAGTPPTPTDPSEVFTRNRTDALSGEADDVLYVECSADPKTDPTTWPKGYVDFEAIAAANPSYPARTPRVSILRMSRQLSRASLRREGLGIWDDGPGVKAAIPADDWAALAVTTAPVARKKALGVRFSTEGAVVAVAGAQWSAERTLVEGIQQSSTGDGLGGLVAWIADRWRDYGAIIIDGKAGAATLTEALRKRGVPARFMHTPTAGEFITAHSTFLEAVNSGRLAHSAQPGLTASIAAAAQHVTTRGWWWESIGDGDILLAEAATLALWGVETKAKAPAAPPKRIY